MLGLTQTVSEYIALEWLNTRSALLSLLNEKQNGENLILLLRFIVFMFFPDAPKLGLDFSATTSNSRLSTMARTGLSLYETQNKRGGRKKTLFSKHCKLLLL